MRIVPEKLPSNSYLVRICEGEGPEYSRMIVVTLDEDSIFLRGWIGKPLSPSEWKKAAKEYFPGITKVKFERYRNGVFQLVELNL
jgi:hypothetical protein